MNYDIIFLTEITALAFFNYILNPLIIELSVWYRMRNYKTIKAEIKPFPEVNVVDPVKIPNLLGIYRCVHHTKIDVRARFKTGSSVIEIDNISSIHIHDNEEIRIAFDGNNSLSTNIFQLNIFIDGVQIDTEKWINDICKIGDFKTDITEVANKYPLKL